MRTALVLDALGQAIRSVNTGDIAACVARKVATGTTAEYSVRVRVQALFSQLFPDSPLLAA
jgi:hypothetical protein